MDITAGGEFTSRSSLRPAGNDIGGNESPYGRSRLMFSLIGSRCVAQLISRPQKAVDVELTCPPRTVNQCRFGGLSNASRRYRVFRDALIASQSDEHRAGERRIRRRPATLAAAARVDAARVVVARCRRRRAGPLRQRNGRPRGPAAARRSAGLVGAQHTGIVLRQLGWHTGPPGTAERWPGRCGPGGRC